MMKKNFVFFFVCVAVLVFLLDQALKYWVLVFLPEWQRGILNIHFVKNTGAGFGILQGQPLFLGIISLVVAILVIINYAKIGKEIVPQLLWAFFLGGVMGNLADRIWRRYVIDFIDFSFWPAFNVADAALTVAVIGLIVYYYWKK